MRVLKKLPSTKKIEKLKYNFFVFDTETTKLEPQPKNFVFGVLYGYDFEMIFYTIEEFKKEVSKKKYSKKIIFAHNAEFDLSVIFGNIYTELDNSAIFNGSFISAKYKHTTFADSLNVFPASVEKIGKTIGKEKKENNKISSEGLKKSNISKLDIEYCIRDCEIVFTALLKIFERVGKIKITISSLSMQSFRANYLKNDLYYSELNDEFFESYYGGRTEAFKLGSTKSKVFDINSLYPYIMTRVVFPDIKNLKKEVKVDVRYLKYLLKNSEGLAKVRVFHKQHYFGFLPKRHEVNKVQKLIFPVGTFETTVNFNELRFALKHNIIDILDVDYVVHGLPTESIFKEFINDIYSHRLNSEFELDKYIDKLLMNSNYGRWAMRMKFTTSYYNQIPFDLINELELTEKYHKLKIFSEVRKDCFLITENEKFKNSFFAIATFSSYITSEARIMLLESLLENEQNEITYCDTDSVFLEGNFKGSLGNELGKWKLEDKEVIEINGLKNYVYIDNDGNEHEAIKGISKKAKKIGVGKYEIVKYNKTKESLRRNTETGKQVIVVKQLKHKYDKRIISKDNINTKPIKL